MSKPKCGNCKHFHFIMAIAMDGKLSIMGWCRANREHTSYHNADEDKCMFYKPQKVKDVRTDYNS